MATKTRGYKGLVMALTLALALWGAKGNPSPLGIVLLSAGIAVCLWYEAAGWAVNRSSLSPAEKIGRSLVLTFVVCGIAAAYGWQFFPDTSFPFVKPGVVLDPNSTSSYWLMVVVNRGKEATYNVDVIFQDQVMVERASRELQRNDLSLDQRSKLVQLGRNTFHYPELDPNANGGTDNEVDKFFWRPLAMGDERYEMLITYRAGAVRETMRIKNIGDKWVYAVHVANEASKRNLINCKDEKFPEDDEFKEGLPTCFPKYPN
jgi:hypothetical protein